MREEFEKWAGKHQYLPIVERDFWAVWMAAWKACEEWKKKTDEAAQEGAKAGHQLKQERKP